MVCICSCGKEYGFEPVGYWCCPLCWRLNYTGTPFEEVSSPEIDPDSAEEMYRSDTDFDREANLSAHSNPGSWRSWYAIGIAYARRLNLFQTGIFCTCSLCIIERDSDARSFLERTKRMFVEVMIRDRLRNRKYNAPHLASMEYHCIRRFPEMSEGYCNSLADMIYDSASSLDVDARFSMVNLCSRIRISGMPVHPDLISYRDCLWLTMPYRVALTDTDRVISDTNVSEIRRLAALQPDDGTAGFVNHLNNAIHKGGELALMRAERRHDEEKVTRLEDDVFEEIRQYLDKYIAGSQDTVPENRVMTGPPQMPETSWMRTRR